MHTLFFSLGWCFAAISVLYLLGLVPSLARYFYPTKPSVLVRSAAPILFALLAMGCFKGSGLPVMIFVVVAGVFLIAISPRNTHRLKA